METQLETFATSNVDDAGYHHFVLQESPAFAVKRDSSISRERHSEHKECIFL